MVDSRHRELGDRLPHSLGTQSPCPHPDLEPAASGAATAHVSGGCALRFRGGAPSGCQHQPRAPGFTRGARSRQERYSRHSVQPAGRGAWARGMGRDWQEEDGESEAVTLALTGSQAACTGAVTGTPYVTLLCRPAPKLLEGGKDRRTRVQGRGGRAVADRAHAASSAGRLLRGSSRQQPDPRDARESHA